MFYSIEARYSYEFCFHNCSNRKPVSVDKPKCSKEMNVLHQSRVDIADEEDVSEVTCFRESLATCVIFCPRCGFWDERRYAFHPNKMRIDCLDPYRIILYKE